MSGGAGKPAQERTPPPPAPVLAWVERYGNGGPGNTGSLHGRGATALALALRTPSGSREAAWALLAADALLTWAVEDAADAPDPAVALEEILRAAQAPRVGRRP